MAQSIQKVTPRHAEIMRRLTYGETQRDIARDLGMNEGRLSIIVNSPLFQLELRRLQHRREERINSIQDKIIEGAEKSITLHNQIIDGVIMLKDGEGEIAVDLPISARQQSATAIANLFLRLTKGSSLSPGEEEEGGYESRLEREVIFKETEIKRKKSTPLDIALDVNLPPDYVLDREDEEVLEAMAQ